MSRAIARICDDDRACSGVMSGRDQEARSLMSKCGYATLLIPLGRHEGPLRAVDGVAGMHRARAPVTPGGAAA